MKNLILVFSLSLMIILWFAALDEQSVFSSKTLNFLWDLTKFKTTLSCSSFYSEDRFPSYKNSWGQKQDGFFFLHSKVCRIFLRISLKTVLMIIAQSFLLESKNQPYIICLYELHFPITLVFEARKANSNYALIRGKNSYIKLWILGFVR